MFYEYSINQWISVGLYMIFIVALFTGIAFLSIMATNYISKEEHKRNKLKYMRNERLRKSNKKRYFIDVA
jgi:predicted RND superfamily exporter protein